MATDRSRIMGYCLLAFGFTWALAGIGWLLGIDAGSGLQYMVLAGLCMFGPAIAAIIRQRRIERLPWSGLGVNLAGTRWRTVVMTCLVGMLIAPLYLLCQHLLGDVLGVAAFGHVEVSNERMSVAIVELVEQLGGKEVPDAGHSWIMKLPAWLALVVIQFAALFSAFSLNLLFMLGEELGWRGYLWQVTRGWSGLHRVGLTGVLWGLWHAPLIALGHNYPGFPVSGIGMMVVLCTLLALLFDWTRTRSRSIWSSAVLHGLINGSVGGAVLFAWGGHPLVGSLVGVAGFIVLAALGLCVVAFDGKYRAALLSAPQPAA